MKIPDPKRGLVFALCCVAFTAGAIASDHETADEPKTAFESKNAFESCTRGDMLSRRIDFLGSLKEERDNIEELQAEFSDRPWWKKSDSDYLDNQYSRLLNLSFIMNSHLNIITIICDVIFHLEHAGIIYKSDS